MSFCDEIKKEIKDNTSVLARTFYDNGKMSDLDAKHYELSLSPSAQDSRAFDIELIENNITASILGKTYYIKKFDEIIKFLQAIGANGAVFTLLDNKVLREIKAGANRGVNFETSNLKRQAESTKSQIDTINKLDLNKLSDKYKRIAKTRLENPNDTMSELAGKLNMTKSGLTYAFRRMKSLI